jgi:hypothetical protein
MKLPLLMKASLLTELPFSFLPFAFPSMLPLFASASLPPIKALAWQTPFVGGGASFSLYFPKLSPDNEDFLVSLASYSGWFQRPEGFYYPSFIKEMPVGWERYESFLAFQKELNAFLFPYFVKAFPLAESLGEEGFLSSVLPYSQKYERKKAWLSLPQRKSAEGEA